MVTMNRKPHSATARLKQDYLRLKKDPVPYVVAEPVPSNILVWHYVVKGPENTPYEGGFYHGKLVFPGEFPFQPPSIFMTTPNGRFKVNTRLCLSISDFHPDTWNPTWSVSTILTGLLSFMVSINGIARIRWLAVSIDSPPSQISDSIILCAGFPLVSRTTPWSSYGYDSLSLHFKLVIPEIEKSPTLGSINTTDSEKRKWALQSLDFNLKDKMFCELFPETVEEIHTELGRREEMQKQTRHQTTTAEVSSLIRDQLQREQSLFNSAMTNLCVILGLAAFAYSVKYVLWSIAME